MQSEYRECRLCPRRCGCDRTQGQTGICGETDQCRIASVCAHFGEEPPISGTRGSGTIFFTGCSCRCFFCQNHQISRGMIGEPTPTEVLIAQLEALADRGVHNLNFVTPDHFLPHVEHVCMELRQRGYTLPFVHNGSGYMSREIAERCTNTFDIFLPDFKFSDPKLANECIGDEHYPRLALESLRELVAARGTLRPWDPSGETPACEGVLVRHLVLPGQVENSLATLDTLYREFGPDLPLSIMSQFRPMPDCHHLGKFERPLHADEYEQVCLSVQALGFNHVFLQEMTAEEGYLPDFRNSANPFPANP